MKLGNACAGTSRRALSTRQCPTKPCRRVMTLHAEQGYKAGAKSTAHSALLKRRKVLQSTLGIPITLSGLLQLPSFPALATPEGPRYPTSQELEAINEVMEKFAVKNKAPVLLRLVFHDAGTFSASQYPAGGANASIIWELQRPESFGLKRACRTVEQMGEAIKQGPAGENISVSDLLVFAGARAVAQCGGPQIRVRVGRQDATGPDPEGRLPDEKASADELKRMFADKGFNPREMVALSGAHTIGGKGFGDYYTFDNVYYRELLRKPWAKTSDSMAQMIGLPSDHVMPDDPELLPFIQEYAQDQGAFFRDFEGAFLKLTELGATWR